eukprot:251645_1
MALLDLIDMAEILVDKFAISTTAKACGKVLITGGYLILFHEYRGISIALNCEFHATLNVYHEPNTIHILCPQWIETELFYHITPDYCIQSSNNHQSKNAFIENSLQCFIRFLHETDATQLHVLEQVGFEIALCADDAFYNTIKGDIKHKDRKMGLGSSAALTVALIRCLFNFFDLRNHARVKESDLHDLCQLSHFMAQGKIGSGFDIATALFGSILFRRSTLTVDKALFEGYLDRTKGMQIGNILDCMEMSTLQSVTLPPFMCILMAVPRTSLGSKTPHMVAKVLKWKQTNETKCRTIWNPLDECNEDVINILQAIEREYHRIGEREYMHQMAQFCETGDAISTVANQLRRLRSVLRDIRQYQKEMSAQSDVDIVPKVMDHILNELASNPRVIEGGLPGAGGFDAIYVLCVGTKQSAMQQLQPVCGMLNVEILDI